MEPKKLNSLQAGRGIAAMMVVLYHANGKYGFGGRKFLGHLFNFGFAGVDFFFVLSGFIIAYTSWHYIGQKNGLGQFARKRLIRLYPIYWVYLAVALFGGYAWYHDKHAFDQLIDTMLLIPGMHYVIKTSWTLPYELFFYLMFGLLIFSRWALVFIVPLVLLSCWHVYTHYTHSYGILNNQVLNDICTPFNVEFLLGVAAFRLYHKISIKAAIAMPAAALLVFAVFIATHWTSDLTSMFPGQRLLPFGLPAFLLVTAMAAIDSRKTYKIWKPLVMLGDASYTLYLIHFNIFVFVNDTIFSPLHLSETSIAVLMLPVVAATVYLSILLYKYVEMPMLKKLSARKRSKDIPLVS